MNLMKVVYQVGEVWYDQAGNECVMRENGTIKVSTVNNQESLTIQSEKDSCDIDKIVAKFKTTGIMLNVRTEQPIYGDFSDVCDYASAVQRVQEAEEAFMTLSADIRKRFDNDPGKLIDFLENSENRLEAIKLGLIAGENAEVVAHSPAPSAEVKTAAGPSFS